MGAAKTRRNVQGGNINKLIVSGGIVLCLLVGVVSLYPALREYYLAYRVNEQLLQELEAVKVRNDEIQGQIDYLNTQEGVADRARERYGWVREGETAVNITGLEISDATTILPETITSGSIEAPSTWWTSFLDMLFAVEEKETAEPIPDPFISD